MEPAARRALFFWSFVVMPASVLRIPIIICLLTFTSGLADDDLVNPWPDVSDSSVVPDSMTVSADAEPSCRITIGRLLVEDMQLGDTLDLMIESRDVEVAGFMLKFAVASDYVDIVEILPGELIDSCNWEMFTARQIPAQNPEEAPRELWQITALAQGVSGTKVPLCFGFDRPATLARLVLSSTHVSMVPDTTAEIFFYWESCRDNVISDREGASILVSDTVINEFSVAFETERDVFPTRCGTPEECISPRAANPPRRLVEFHNGGVEFRVSFPEDLPDSTSTREDQEE